MEREEVRFASATGWCAAWHYPGDSGACVVMAGGIGVTKEPATDLFAAAFQRAGLSVLAFDYRRFGGSGGTPRQVPRLRDEVADWGSAVRHAAALPEVDPARIALWGFSTAGGHVLRVAARHPGIAAVIAQSPNVDGAAATRSGVRHQRPAALLAVLGLAALDGFGGLAGRRPVLLPLSGPPGSRALLTTPDWQDADAALDPGGRYPGWQREVAARTALRLGAYRPGRDAPRIRCPLLVVTCDDDRTAPVAPAARVAARAPRGEHLALPGGHYAPFLAQHERALEAELAFLRRHVLAAGPVGRMLL